MCGIVAIMAKNKTGFNQNDCNIFQQMLYADAVRGWDATGMFGVNKLGNVDIKKQASAAGYFVATQEYKKFSEQMFQTYQMVVGHNRKATHGEKNNDSAHPFWDKEEKICLVHNGMISNYKEYCTDSTVDSAAIANALANKDIEEVISTLEGAFAFIWYNIEEKKVYFIRNVQRPLYALETTNNIIFASEDSMAFWIAKRNNTHINTCTELKAMTLYSFSLEERKFVEEKTIEIKKKLTPVTQTMVTPGVIYLPSAQGGWTRKTTIVNDLETAPDTFFLTDTNIKTIADIAKHITKGDRLLTQVDSYEKFDGKEMYKIYLNLLNCSLKELEIVMYISGKVFDSADFTEALSVTVKNITYKQNKCTLFVGDMEEHSLKETLNEMQVADAMYFDERFPVFCSICNGQTKWDDLDKCETIFDKTTDVTLLCKNCTGVACND